MYTFTIINMNILYYTNLYTKFSETNYSVCHRFRKLNKISLQIYTEDKLVCVVCICVCVCVHVLVCVCVRTHMYVIHTMYICGLH